MLAPSRRWDGATQPKRKEAGMPTPELKKGDLFRFVQSRRQMEEVVDRRFGELHEELKIKIPDPAKKFFDDTWYDDKVNW